MQIKLRLNFSHVNMPEVVNILQEHIVRNNDKLSILVK